ncbi:MAG: sialate O-acetylesterase [Coraliomargarita sp.]
MKTKSVLIFLALFITSCLPVVAVSLPAIFGDHMVLQRGQANPVWGKASPGETITVRIDGQEHRATAGKDGRWRVELDAMPAGGPHVLEVSGRETLQFEDVLVGEVWLCSGQSNMQWAVSNSGEADLEIVSAGEPSIRLITVPNRGSQEPLDDFKGKWAVCSPDSVAGFSAVGYHFGRRLHQVLGVPVGLVNNAWGGSAAEAWVPREVLECHERYAPYLAASDAKTAAHTDEIQARNEARFKAWQEGGRKGKRPPWPNDPRYGQHRPANLYNGVLHPVLGYGIRGVIWYQGETNVGRAADYNHLFSLMIRTWREHWGQGDFPFFWVQLADFHAERDLPSDSGWARLREAQTATLSLPNTGQAVIIDAGEGRDIHPRDKRVVGDRLARHALAKTYGVKIASESPRFASMEIKDGAARLAFDHVSNGGLYAFDVAALKGFAVAGADRQFKWAEAKIQGRDKVVVSHPEIPEPVAVRYGWADNPVVNLYDRNGLPVTPFRTDSW